MSSDIFADAQAAEEPEFRLADYQRERLPEPPRFDLSELASRIGGHFRLCALVTKRSRELMGGSRKMTELRAKSHINIALKEFDENRIELLTAEEAKRRLLGGGDDEEESSA